MSYLFYYYTFQHARSLIKGENPKEINGGGKAMRKWGKAGSGPPWLCPGSKMFVVAGLWMLSVPTPEEMGVGRSFCSPGKALMFVPRFLFSPAITFTLPLHKYCSSMWPFKAEEKNMWSVTAPKGRYKQLLPGLSDIPTLGCVTACRHNPCKFRDLHIFKMPSSCSSSWAIFYLRAVLLPALGYRPLPLLGLPPLGSIFRKTPRALSTSS